MIILSPQSLTDPSGVARALASELHGQAEPVFAVWMGGEEVAEGVKILNAAGIPTCETPEQAVNTFMEMYFYSRHLGLLQETPPQMAQDLNINTRRARTFIDQCLAPPGDHPHGAGVQGHSLGLRHSHEPHGGGCFRLGGGERRPESRVPSDHEDQFPGYHPQVRGGGVRLHIHSDSEVLAAFREITEEARAQRTEAHILGVTVQEQDIDPTANCSSAASTTRISAP